MAHILACSQPHELLVTGRSLRRFKVAGGSADEARRMRTFYNAAWGGLLALIVTVSGYMSGAFDWVGQKSTLAIATAVDEASGRERQEASEY